MSSKTVGQYLIDRLYSLGVGHVFGVPGDFVLGFYDLLVKSPIQVVNTSDEQGAGFAADAYARIKGLGVVCVTYSVGGLKVANTTAEAFAEKSPVVVISGAPGISEQSHNPLLHHKVRDFDTQKKIFEHLTVASTVLDNPQTACQEIDRVLQMAMKFKRPVYIELPRDQVHAPVSPHNPVVFEEKSDPRTLEVALKEIVSRLNAAKNPVILAGVEVHRFGGQDALVQLAERAHIPVASTLLSKSVMAETHPYYLGVYEGSMGHEEVKKYLETSDCVLMLGAFLTDIEMGLQPPCFQLEATICITSEACKVGYHRYDDILFLECLEALSRAQYRVRSPEIYPHPQTTLFTPSDQKITIAKLFACLNMFIDDKMVVISDVGDALFAAADLVIHSKTEFISPAYYASIGFSVPASIGAALALEGIRPLVIVGDGAFQMTGMELSTIARFGLNPIVVLLNNQGYGIERPMLDGPFNDLHPWQYSRIPEILGVGNGIKVETEAAFQNALTAAKADTMQFTLIEVIIDKHDASEALKRLTANMAKRV